MNRRWRKRQEIGQALYMDFSISFRGRPQYSYSSAYRAAIVRFYRHAITLRVDYLATKQVYSARSVVETVSTSSSNVSKSDFRFSHLSFATPSL